MNPGIYYDLSRAEYDAIPGVNKSTLWKFWQNPRAFELAGKVFKDSDPMRWGRLFESVLFGEDLSEFVVLTKAKRDELLAQAQERQGKKASSKFSKNLTEYRQWKEEQEQAGLTIISEWTLSQVNAAVDEMREEPSCAALLGVPFRTQVAVVWNDPATGLLCKGLIDMVTEGDQALADIKTTSAIATASRLTAPWKFRNQVRDLGYHVQAYAYLAGWKHAQEQSGNRVEAFERYSWRFLVSGALISSLDSVEPPFSAAAWSLAPEDIALGGEIWHEALAEWQIAHDSNKFSGLTSSETFPELPRLNLS